MKALGTDQEPSSLVHYQPCRLCAAAHLDVIGVGAGRGENDEYQSNNNNNYATNRIDYQR